MSDNILDIPVYGEKKASGINQAEQAFYAASAYSEQPVDDYLKAMAEYNSTGSSSFVKEAEQRWMKEQDAAGKAYILDVLQNPTISPELKRAEIQTYAMGGEISQSLRDKYVATQAPKGESHRAVAKDLEARTKELALNEQEGWEKIKGMWAVTSGAGMAKATNITLESLAASLPAGWAGLLNLIAYQNPDMAAKTFNNLMSKVQKPEDLQTEAALGIIQEAAQTLDIPFKWIGDTLFDLTGSPGLAASGYSLASMAGYYGAYKGTSAVAEKVLPKVSPTSAAGATQHANPSTASSVGVAALVDDKGALVKALGTNKDALISDWTLPSIAQDFGPMRPDLMARLEEGIDTSLAYANEVTRINPAIYPKSLVEADVAVYQNIVSNVTGPQYMQSSSFLRYNGSEVNGSLIFGSDAAAGKGYTTELAADNAVQQLQNSVAHLPKDMQGIFTKKIDNGEYYVQWDVKKTYPINSAIMFGTDALKAEFNTAGVPILGWLAQKSFDVTKWANKPLGKNFYPSYLRMKEWIPTDAALSEWTTTYVKGKYLDAIHKNVVTTKHPKELEYLLKEGSNNGKVYTVSDVQNMFPSLKKIDVEELHYNYAAYVRITQHAYRMADRVYSGRLAERGMEGVYDAQGQRVGFASSKITADDKPLVAFDFATGRISQVENNPKQLVLLDSPRIVGQDVVRYGLIGNETLQPIRPGSLTYIPGYIPRNYKNMWWVVDAVPKRLYQDGQQVSPDKLRDFKKAIGGAKTKQQADLLVAKFQQQDPNFNYSTRKENARIEDQIIMDSQIYETYYKDHHKRGKPLASLYGDFEQVDPVVSLERTVSALSRVTGWDDYMRGVKDRWVKEYGEYSGGKFPDQATDIVAKRHMDAAEEAKYNAAVEIYQQLKAQQYSELYSDKVWKDAFNAVADTFEKFKLPNELLREIGESGNALAKAATTLPRYMYLYYRPGRMWVVQPQQYTELATISPTYLKNSIRDTMPVYLGIVAKTLYDKGVYVKNGKMVHDSTAATLRALTDFIGPKMNPEHVEIVKAFYETGIVQAVDTNILRHGLWKDPEMGLQQKNLVLSVGEKGVKAPAAAGKIGRAVGYDAAELMNQVTLWLFAKQKWEGENPGKAWNTPENRTAIAGAAWRLGHGASTRAAMMPWQEGISGVFFQFASVPHKAMMQQFATSDFTPTQKANLAAARMFWYGVYGVPMAVAFNSLLDNYADEGTKKNWEGWKRGFADWVTNNSINMLSDEKTDIAVTKSVQPLPESVFFFDFAKALYDMASGDHSEKVRFPFITAGGSVYTAVRTMWDIFTATPGEVGSKEWEQATLTGLSIAAGFNDWMKFELIRTTRDNMTKAGVPLGTEQTIEEAIARLLTGISSQKEVVIWEALANKTKREKYIKQSGKEVYERMTTLRNKLGTQEFPQEMKMLNSLMSGFEPKVRQEIANEFFKLDRVQWLTVRESVLMYIWQHAKGENDKWVQNMVATLGSAEGDHKIIEMLKKEGML